MKKVRMHNLDGGYYTLSGSLTDGEGRLFEYDLPPERDTEVTEEVYQHLKTKFGPKPMETEAPAALPNPDGSYTVPRNTMRKERHRQYLIEFLSG